MILLLRRGLLVGKGGTIQMVVILMFNFQFFFLKRANSFLTCNEHCREDMREKMRQSIDLHIRLEAVCTSSS